MPVTHRVLRWLGRSRWLRFGVRARIVRALVDPETAPAIGFEEDFFGLRYRGRLDDFIDWNVYFFGAYEAPELALIDALLRDRREAVCVDVGANTGHHALFLSSRSRAVHAFEPYAPVREVLEQRLADNAVSNVVVHPVGLGRRRESLPFAPPGGANRGTGSFRAVPHAAERLDVVSGDEHLAALGLERLDLLKIDVEGFERDALEGLRETLDRHRPAVMMEFSEATRESLDPGQDLLALFPPGYRARRIESHVPCALLFCCHLYRLVDFDGREGNLLLTPR